MDQTKSDITARIQELKAYVEKAKVKLTPEINRLIRVGIENVQSKIVAKKPVTQADMAFIDEAKAMVEAERFIQRTLKDRFEAHPERHKGIAWPEVERVLRAHPEAMVSLGKMEETGGEPDMIDMEGDVFIFGDCSAESPLGRRNLDYYQSAKMANGFGVELMDETIYRKIQKTKNFDLGSYSWLKTTEDVLKAGRPFYGGRRGGVVVVNQYDACYHNDNNGFRCVLRVKKA